MHVTDGAWLRQDFGVAGAIARVDRDRTAGRGGNQGGEVFPVRGGSEAFVKEYEFGEVRVARYTQDFEIASLNFDFVESADWRGLTHEIETAMGRAIAFDLLKIAGNSECSRRGVFCIRAPRYRNL